MTHVFMLCDSVRRRRRQECRRAFAAYTSMMFCEVQESITDRAFVEGRPHTASANHDLRQERGFPDAKTGAPEGARFGSNRIA
ncbi:MAG: hypothetical protein GYA63_00825 [Armatimonadetes bacterium]|nr:hypothetical protein [Armatimonadota bacterium]HOC31440.1 hypothetical protein [Armatimonadota bacterium]